MSSQQLDLRSQTQIFVIDDEPIMTSVIEAYLAKAGYTNTQVFNNSVEALETLEEIGADLIITDVNMPELGGKYLTKLIRQNPRFTDTPIIAVTSDNAESTIERLEEYDVFEVLSKPLQRREFIQTVHVAIENHQLEMQRRNHQAETMRKMAMEKSIRNEKSVRALFNREQPIG